MNRVLEAAKVPAMVLGSVTGIGYGLTTGWWPITTLGVLLVPVAAWHAAGHARWALIGATLFIAGLVLRIAPTMPLHTYWLLFVTLGVLDVAGTAVWWHHHRTSTAGTISKWDRRSRRNGGVASPWAVLHTGWHVRSQARILRPSLKGLSWWRLQRVPLTELGSPLAKVWWFRVWGSFRDCFLYLGSTGRGKSGALADAILAAPKNGAVLAASRRQDLMEHTSALRSEHGGRVGLYNPGGVGDFASTVTFDPRMGCENPETAIKRALALLTGTKTATAKDGDSWIDQGARMLAPILHAAAISGATMDHVNAWVTNPTGTYDTVMEILSHSPQKTFPGDFHEYATMGNPGSSVRMTIKAAFKWVTSEAAMASVQPSEFDVAAFLDNGDTIYLFGDNSDAVAPLMTAFTMYIGEEAERIAKVRGGRHDPPLTMVLDEVANCCPVPLPEWSSIFGGLGVRIYAGAQSFAQLEEKYGEKGARAIKTNMNTIFVLGGTDDEAELRSHAVLIGEKEVMAVTYTSAGTVASMTPHKVPVMSQDQIMRMPPFKAVILSDSMPTAIGRLPMVWENPRYRRAHRAARRAGVPSLTTRLRSLCHRFGPAPAVEPARRPIAALPLGHTEQVKRDRAAYEARELQGSARNAQRRDLP